MPLKRFEPTPEPTPEPVQPNPEVEAVKASPFSPWIKGDDEKKSVLGERAYSSENAIPVDRTDAQDVLNQLLSEATGAFQVLEDLCRLYMRAAKNPIASNVKAYSEKVAEVSGGDTKIATLLGVAVMTIVGTFNGGK